MATEDREMMEGRGAGESCPTFPKMVPDDPMSEGKSKASLAQEAESPKPDSSYDYHEEMETCEDRGCPGPPKSLSSKASPATTKGQEGDGPERAEPPLAPAAAAPGTPGPQRNDEMELEKMRMEFELERLWYLQEENERQRQHEEVMEQLRQQATPRLFSGGLQDLLLPQNQFAMFLYCFIFIHIIYVTKEMVFFLFSKHYLFCIVAMLLCLIKTLWSYFQLPSPPGPASLMIQRILLGRPGRGEGAGAERRGQRAGAATGARAGIRAATEAAAAPRARRPLPSGGGSRCMGPGGRPCCAERRRRRTPQAGWG
ncbi:LOW QUALITY PROTEIN: transmembrane protein 247 [Lagenorhynchus albirostris]|uniref:LOW QUALITY PROTEIN: transmembrane protein 247 n=1 Tax=Lagenorhynchus albirostris TaxID=27610 RepID=UPI0028E6AC05|nr:LOW QUALITY PROTEIN: transmembrane protein 247 [Lagenorhynchus albirostris]